MEQLALNAREFGVEYYDEHDRRQGVVHIVGPEQGFTLPYRPVKPGPVDPLEGGLFAGEELQGLAPDVFHHLRGLRQGERPGPDFGQGQVHQKPQVSELAVLFPNSLAAGWDHPNKTREFSRNCERQRRGSLATLAPPAIAPLG